MITVRANPARQGSLFVENIIAEAERITETAPAAPQDVPECIRCYEDFPEQPVNKLGWNTGLLRRLTFAPEWIRRKFEHHGDTERQKYLCGNCYFDLTDNG